MDSTIKKWIIAGVSVFVLCGLLFFSCFTVSPGERGIVTRMGNIQAVVSEGVHWKLPFLDSVTKVDVRTQKAHSPAQAGTKDLQVVATEVALNYHLNPALLEETFAKFGLDLEEKVIDPRIQETVKATIAKFSAEELLVKREQVRSQIVETLSSTLKQYNIILEDVQITNFSFAKSFDAAIESKQTAEQNALKAKNDLERIKVEAQQKIVTSQAEAETIKIQAAAIREQGGEAYVQLKAIEKWDGKLPAVNNGSLPFVNLTNGKVDVTQPLQVK